MPKNALCNGGGGVFFFFENNAQIMSHYGWFYTNILSKVQVISFHTNPSPFVLFLTNQSSYLFLLFTHLIFTLSHSKICRFIKIILLLNLLLTTYLEIHPLTMFSSTSIIYHQVNMLLKDKRGAKNRSTRVTQHTKC
ncbi:hypothetical protein HanXRQr2_Chr11g0474811 [Helianthus annuus]|uniref:Uncharacterized protein n=1 Tax=Helianthus annuus TaxID=4232 RepID=A0A251TBU9_HELAN|nr:hypothetical protein HanXRQr2_Chr11g0474811 [Helianthus annuus]KAJ0873901.1 hypothetical protein HanPSC8_Chr11g0457851 [Helianthus annuus]